MRFQAHFLISKLGCCLAQPWMGCTYHILPYKDVRMLKEEGIEIQKPELVDGFKETLFSVYTKEDAHVNSQWLWLRAQSLYRPKPDIYLSFVCMCLHVFTCYHMHHGVLVRVRGRLLRTGTVFPACFHPGLNSGHRLGSRQFYPRNHFTCLRNIPVVFFLDIWHCVHRKADEYTLQLDIQMPWWHFYSNNELGLLSTSLRLWAPIAGFQLGIIETRIFRVFYDFFFSALPRVSFCFKQGCSGSCSLGQTGKEARQGQCSGENDLEPKDVCEEVASPRLYLKWTSCAFPTSWNHQAKLCLVSVTLNSPPRTQIFILFFS